jgi:hypothetical protein
LPSEDRGYFLQLHLLQFGTVPIGHTLIAETLLGHQDILYDLSLSRRRKHNIW